MQLWLRSEGVRRINVRVSVKNRPLAIALVALATHLFTARAADKPHGEVAGKAPAVLWTDPTDWSARDLYYGIGGRKHEPHGQFAFVKEDLNGTNPKFTVTDSEGTKWKVKLGLEARSETTASRLVWAAGYYATEDYFVPEMQVSGMPPHLHRGQKLIGAGGVVRNARLKREGPGEKKSGIWQWNHNEFTGTREWNGLRTLMALINNWDLKDENNAIYREGGANIFLVSDLGASFGSTGRTWPRDRAKDNLESYRLSKFIRRSGPDTVDFQAPSRPGLLYLINPKEYLSRVHLERLGRNVPRADAKWLGGLLDRLSSAQIRDAFRAAGYSPEEVEAFSRILKERITTLTDL
jgi:hypothetical protein